MACSISASVSGIRTGGRFMDCGVASSSARISGGNSLSNSSLPAMRRACWIPFLAAITNPSTSDRSLCRVPLLHRLRSPNRDQHQNPPEKHFTSAGRKTPLAAASPSALKRLCERVRPWKVNAEPRQVLDAIDQAGGIDTLRYKKGREPVPDRQVRCDRYFHARRVQTGYVNLHPETHPGIKHRWRQHRGFEGHVF